MSTAPPRGGVSAVGARRGAGQRRCPQVRLLVSRLVSTQLEELLTDLDTSFGFDETVDPTYRIDEGAWQARSRDGGAHGVTVGAG